MVAGSATEAERILLGKATTAVERLQRGLEMMTEAARLEIGTVLPRVRPFPLKALLHELRDQHEAAAHGGRLMRTRRSPA